MRVKSELLRIALARPVADRAPLAVLDRDARMPGRGAYLCLTPGGAEPRRDCLRAALRHGGIQRTLRARAALDDKLVESVGR